MGPQSTASAPGEPGITTEPAPKAVPPPDVEAASADLRTEIISQVQAGRLDPAAAYDLYGKVGQVEREAGEGDWGAARYYAGRIREKLRKDRDDRLVTFVAYQSLVAKLDVLDSTLS